VISEKGADFFSVFGIFGLTDCGSCGQGSIYGGKGKTKARQKNLGETAKSIKKAIVNTVYWPGDVGGDYLIFAF